MKNTFILLLLFVFGVAYMSLSRVSDGYAQEQAIRAPREGFLAPNYTGTLATGQSLLAEDLSGTPVVLNFWASWCPPCRAEMPTLQKMSEHYSLAGVRFITVNSTVQDTPQNAQAFLSENQITIDTVMDPDGSITRAFEITSLPTTFFISPNGKVYRVIVGGPVSEASLRTNIEQMLEEAAQ